MANSPPPYYQDAPGQVQQPPAGPGAAYYVPYPPPQAGGYPPYNYPYPPPADPSQAAPPAQTQQPKTTTTTIVINATGNCPRCRVGNLHNTYTPLGICCAICFFPIGMICCMLWTEKKCDRCGAAP